MGCRCISVAGDAQFPVGEEAGFVLTFLAGNDLCASNDEAVVEGFGEPRVIACKGVHVHDYNEVTRALRTGKSEDIGDIGRWIVDGSGTIDVVSGKSADTKADAAERAKQ